MTRRQAAMKIGERYGRLTVLKLIPGTHTRHSRARCVCDCGGERTVQRGDLRSGATTSCGCRNREVAAETIRKLLTTHGFTAGGTTPEYRAWANARRRTTNPNDEAWKNYGGRGIRMAPEWLNNFPAFLAYIGLKPLPSLTLDRIDNDGHYEPGNVRWATRLQQTRNRRSQAERESAGRHAWRVES